MTMARIEHVAIFTYELDRLKDFYLTHLGLRVAVDNSRAPVRGYFLADDQGLCLEIIERPADVADAKTRYVVHVAFLVDDYPAARARLEAAGVVFEPDSEVLTSDFQTGFFHDPAGNRCQIVWRKRPLVS